MKKLELLCLFCILLCLTSCIPQNTEIKHRLVIEGIGVDYDSENDIYELTVQVLETSESTPEEGKSTSPVTNYTVKGKTVAEAINSLSENTGKYPLYSQNRLILLGTSVTDGQMIKALNFFVREYTSRPDVFIAAASGKASDVLTVDISGTVTAKLIESEIKQCNKNSISVDTELYNTVNLSLEKTTCLTLPLVEVVDDRIPGNKTVKVTGTRACSKQTEPKMLSSAETMAYLFIMDNISEGSFSIKTREYTAALEIIKSKTTTKLTIKDGKPYFLFSVKCEADVVEFDSNSFTSFNEEDVKEIEKAAINYINSGINGLLDRFTKAEKSDIFRLGTRIKQKYPDIYEKLSADWQEALPTIEYNTVVTVTVGRIGQMTLNSND